MTSLDTKTFMQVQTENAAKQREMERAAGVAVVSSPCGVPMAEPEPVKQQVVKPPSLEKTNG